CDTGVQAQKGGLVDHIVVLHMVQFTLCSNTWLVYIWFSLLSFDNLIFLKFIFSWKNGVSKLIVIEYGLKLLSYCFLLVFGLDFWKNYSDTPISSADWKFAAEQFVKRLPGKVYVHRSQSNYSKLTYDGVDLMGERLAEEVRQVVQRRRNLRKISFVAHSLGGLVTRYAIGKLYEPAMDETSSCDIDKPSDEQNVRDVGKIAGLEPINFITSATPHLGSRLNKQLPFLFGVPLLEKTAAGTAHFIVGRTGKHLFLTDNDDGKPPLLLRMVEDCDDGKFMSALRCFKRRVAYANVTYDHIVGWRTSSLRRQHELPKLKLTANDEKYPHIINVDKGNLEDHRQEGSVEDSLADSYEEVMIRGLTQVAWERVDVCFHKSWLRYNAHNNIQ
ncbi:hypothetical protein ACJX0J_026724, partial [Zea mays]